MSDVFLSYARSTASQAKVVAKALRDMGYVVWLDEDLPTHRTYSDVIEEEMAAAKAALVIWSAEAVKSQWVKSEADAARKLHKLVQTTVDGAKLPMPFDQIQCTDLSEWVGDLEASGWRKVLSSIAALVGGAETPASSVRTPEPLPASYKPDESHMAVAAQKSIAVLPFTDMSERKDQEFLADGMAEEIINLLVRVPELLVSARTSSFYFKGKPTKIPDIARELGVAHVLEGSIRRSGDRLRVTAQLVRADTGYHLWSETYNRELRDVFEVQDDIANAVVQALQIKLMGGELSRRKGGTQNLEAYQLYLRALNALYQDTRSSLDAAEDYLDQVIKLDPSYGMAWALLAASAFGKTGMAVLDPTEGAARVRQLAQHALQLSPDLVEARSTLALALMLNWDWVGAGAEVQRALAIDPTNPAALLAAGYLALALGHWNDAERQIRSAFTRDPLNRYSIYNLGDLYYRTGRYAEAEVMYRRLLELEPGGFLYHSKVGAALLQQGKVEAALAMVQQDPDEVRLAYLPIMLQANGRMAEADEALKALIARWADRGAYVIAVNYAYRGDHDLALQWLERAYQQKDPDFLRIVGEPMLKNLADDPRFKAILRKMNLPE